jgi:hypothetical protein
MTEKSSRNTPQGIKGWNKPKEDQKCHVLSDKTYNS